MIPIAQQEKKTSQAEKKRPLLKARKTATTRACWRGSSVKEPFYG